MKLPQLTFTRFIAALGVVFLHYGAPSIVKLIPESGKIFLYLNSLVSYFFLLSGFILVISSTTKSNLTTNRQFWLNRFARIYPLYLFALLLAAFLLATMGDQQFFYVKSSFIKPASASVLLVQAWIPDYAFYLNYPRWSLSVEALFYVLFPFLFRALKSVPTHSLIVLSIGSDRVIRLFSKPKCVYLGEISYGVYILQAPIAVLARYMNTTYLHWNAPVSFLMFLILLLIFAALCYEWIEKPCRSWMRRLSISWFAQPSGA